MSDPLADAAAAAADNNTPTQVDPQLPPQLPPTGGTQQGGIPGETLQRIIESLQAANDAAARLTGGSEQAGLADFLAGLPTATDQQLEADIDAWITELQQDPAALFHVQFNLFALGEYQGREPRYGVMDTATIAAILNWAQTSDIVRGSRTLGEELEHQRPAEALAANLTAAARRIGSSIISEQARLDPDPIGVVLQNPQTLIALLEDTYAQVGKRPDAADKRAFITAFHAFQRDTALADYRYGEQMRAAAEGQQVEGVAPMAPEQFAESYVREQVGDVPFAGQEAIGIIDTIRGAVAQG